tara:strand:+ start:300 stop:527 length:228 start_codon:yes stop_codon:yes gene_type:complete
MNKEVEKIRTRMRKRLNQSKSTTMSDDNIRITEIDLPFRNILLLTAKFALAGILVSISILVFLLILSSLFGLFLR